MPMLLPLLILSNVHNRAQHGSPFDPYSRHKGFFAY